MKTQNILKNYPVALIAGAVIILFSGVAVWRNSVSAEAKADLAEKEVEASRLSENLHNAQKLGPQLEQISDLSKRISARLSTPTDVAGNQQYFYKLEADSGVKLTDLHQLSSGSKNSKVKSALTLYSTVVYSATVQGDFNHLVGFLKNLESGSRLSTITTAEIGLAAGKAAEEPTPSTLLQLSFNVQLLGTI